MISNSAAELFTEAQRREICDWCRKEKKENCSKCGILKTDPRKEKPNDYRKQK